MLPWLKQVDANRQKDAVHAYYDRALTLIQREVCIIVPNSKRSQNNPVSQPSLSLHAI